MTIHWTKLKRAVEDAGGTWTNRDDAEVFLANAGIEVAEDPAPAPVAQPVDVTFDRSKYYGTVVGSDPRFPGAAYSQGGHYFNAAGKKVG
jgi:hypothetical protein